MHRNPLAAPSIASCRQLIEQRLRFLQIERVEPLSEPAVDGFERGASLFSSSLIAPQPGEARSGSKFEESRLLCARDQTAWSANLKAVVQSRHVKAVNEHHTRPRATVKGCLVEIMIPAAWRIAARPRCGCPSIASVQAE